MLEFVEMDDVKMFFRIEGEEHDELLNFLVEHYTTVLNEKPEVTEANTLTKEALLYAIGCHLTKIGGELISPTIKYVVDDIEEEYQKVDAVDTWCALYRSKIAEIDALSDKKSFGVVGITRKGMRERYGLG